MYLYLGSHLRDLLCYLFYFGWRDIFTIACYLLCYLSGAISSTPFYLCYLMWYLLCYLCDLYVLLMLLNVLLIFCMLYCFLDAFHVCRERRVCHYITSVATIIPATSTVTTLVSHLAVKICLEQLQNHALKTCKRNSDILARLRTGSYKHPLA